MCSGKLLALAMALMARISSSEWTVPASVTWVMRDAHRLAAVDEGGRIAGDGFFKRRQIHLAVRAGNQRQARAAGQIFDCAAFIFGDMGSSAWQKVMPPGLLKDAIESALAAVPVATK